MLLSSVKPIKLISICLLFSLGIAATFFVSYKLSTYLVDDAFITLRYSQHVAQGLGLVFNNGEKVDGYTNFLWTIYLSIPFVLHTAPITFLKISNVILILLSAFLILSIGRKTYFKKNTLFALFPAIMLLLTPFMAISAAEGLETMLFVCLLLLAVWLFLRERSKTFPFSALILVALVLTRPDGIIFLPFFLLSTFLSGAKKRYLFSFLLAFILPTSFFFIIHLLYYQSLLPNTFYAKQGGNIEFLKKSIANQITFFKTSSLWILLLYGISVVKKEFLAINVLFFGIVFSRILFDLWAGGAWMGFFRFLIPILPFAYMLIFAGVLYAAKNKLTLIYTTILVTLLLLIPWRWYPTWQEGLIGYSQGLQKAHIALAQRINRDTSKNTVIAIGDVGALPFYSERTTIDMLGLTDKHIAHLPGSFYHKIDPDYILNKKPDLIILTSSEDHPDFNIALLANDGALANNSVFQKSYTFIRPYKFLPNYYLLVYKRNDTSNVLPEFINNL